MHFNSLHIETLPLTPATSPFCAGNSTRGATSSHAIPVETLYDVAAARGAVATEGRHGER